MRHQYAVERVLEYFPDLEPEKVVVRLRYDSFVSLDKRYMYVQVPKAACTQVLEIMRIIENAPPMKVLTHELWESRRDMFIHAPSNRPLPSLVDLDNRTQREVLESPNFFRMTVVRNPYTRLVSAWRNKILLCEPIVRDEYVRLKGGLPDMHHKSLVTFSEFVTYLESNCDLNNCDPHWRRQVDQIFFPALNLSHVVKLEHLGEGLRRFGQHVNLPDSLVASGKNISIPVGSVTYTQELADRVYALYQSDFETLEYDRDSWRTGSKGINGRAPALWEEKLCDEIIERNVVLSHLYEELHLLQTQLRVVSMLRLLPIVNGLLTSYRKLRLLARKVNQWVYRMHRPREHREQSSATSQ